MFVIEIGSWLWISAFVLVKEMCVMEMENSFRRQEKQEYKEQLSLAGSHCTKRVRIVDQLRPFHSPEIRRITSFHQARQDRRST